MIGALQPEFPPDPDGIVSLAAPRDAVYRLLSDVMPGAQHVLEMDPPPGHLWCAIIGKDETRSACYPVGYVGVK